MKDLTQRQAYALRQICDKTNRGDTLAASTIHGRVLRSLVEAELVEVNEATKTVKPTGRGRLRRALYR